MTKIIATRWNSKQTDNEHAPCCSPCHLWTSVWMHAELWQMQTRFVSIWPTFAKCIHSFIFSTWQLCSYAVIHYQALVWVVWRFSRNILENFEKCFLKKFWVKFLKMSRIFFENFAKYFKKSQKLFQKSLRNILEKLTRL